MPEHEQASVTLPEGIDVLEVSEGVESIDLAVELARKGASLSLVRAIGGEEAVEVVEAQETSPSPSDRNGEGRSATA